MKFVDGYTSKKRNNSLKGVEKFVNRYVTKIEEHFAKRSCDTRQWLHLGNEEQFAKRGCEIRQWLHLEKEEHFAKRG